MTLSDPTAREIGRRLDRQDDVLQEILVQAKATNGRVNALETKRAVDEALKTQTASSLAKHTARIQWITPIAAGVGATFGAVVLAHLL